MRTIKQDVLAGLTCLGLFVAVSILTATPAHAQHGGRPGPPHPRPRFTGGGYNWYPGYDYGYGGYGYGDYGYSGGGFDLAFGDPYGVFGGSAPFQGFADPYGVFGGSSIFDFLLP